MSTEVIDLADETSDFATNSTSSVWVSEVIDLVSSSSVMSTSTIEDGIVDLTKETPCEITNQEGIVVVEYVPVTGAKCPVCLEIKVEHISGDCGHTVCECCMPKVMRMTRKCPTCRANLTKKNLRRLFLNFSSTCDRILAKLSCHIIGRMCDDRRDKAPKRFSAKTALISTTYSTQGRRGQIPDSLVENVELRKSMEVLPSNYNFEILKTIWRLQQAKAKCVALQFPEGLLMYACIISDILRRFAELDHCLVMGDVTYGACCVDDFTATALQCDLLVHYGHSCLVPIDVTQIPCLYVFVTIEIDVDHFVMTLRQNFDTSTRLAIAGTIQFSPAIHAAKMKLKEVFTDVTVPQSRPLSSGEVLGCTAPSLPESTDTLIFIADGRFHLESIMIANPTVKAYRYDPYSTTITKESYDHDEMRRQRHTAIEASRSAKKWGIIQGSLGRQGNPLIVQKLKQILQAAGKTVIQFVMSEIVPDRLKKIEGIEAWVQVGCPRLSIDWGNGFNTPVLTPYEAMVAFDNAPRFWENGHYPMDYYARDGGPWSSSYHKKSKKKSDR